VNERLGGFAVRPSLLQLWTDTARCEADPPLLARMGEVAASDVIVDVIS
jgi:hypothetical protein